MKGSADRLWGHCNVSRVCVCVYACTCINRIALSFRPHFFFKSSLLIPGRSISCDSENYTLTSLFIGVKSLVVPPHSAILICC